MKKHLIITLLIFMIGAMNIYAESKHEITNNAQLEKVSLEIKNLRSKSTEKMVVFTLTLKNTSNGPLGYIVTALIEDKYAGQDTIPTVKAGESVTGKVAVAYDKIPSNFVLTIEDLKP